MMTLFERTCRTKIARGVNACHYYYVYPSVMERVSYESGIHRDSQPILSMGVSWFGPKRSRAETVEVADVWMSCVGAVIPVAQLPPSLKKLPIQ